MHLSIQFASRTEKDGHEKAIVCMLFSVRIRQCRACPSLISSDALAGRDFEIHPQPKIPEIDMYTHMRQWLGFYEGQILGRPLLPDEYLFPHISPNGTAHSTKPMDHSVFQNLLDEFAAGAELRIRFSTHCFRRGGAQYRFMYCPLGERWSLSMIRWWGGWAEGEQVSRALECMSNNGVLTCSLIVDRHACSLPTR